MGQVPDYPNGKFAGEGNAREVEGGNVVVVALNTCPTTRGLLGGVPEEGASADGGAKGQKSGSVGGQI